VILLAHVWRMLRFTMRGSMPAVRHFVAEAKTLFVHVATQWHMRKCPTEARDAPVVGWWLYSGGDTVVPRRWLKHWLMVFGTVTMVVVTAAFLPWFQTDVIHPITHPQRWLGYLATLAMLWGTTDLLVRRARRPRAAAGDRRVPLALPTMLWLSAASGIVLHLARISGLALTTHYAYLVHLCIVVPMVVVEVPFGDWAHMIDRPMALYLQAVRERARRATPVQPAPAPAQP
jgi:heterodisulfide reductase subunit C/quinone-modifying oxidoreductase subunit QmoC